MQLEKIAFVILAVGAGFLNRASAQSQPVCVNNGPYLAECDGQSTFVPVTSTGSTDPDGTPVTFLWFEECSWGFFDDPTSPAPNYVIDIGGFCTRTCVFELRVFSGGEVQKCVSTATIEDTTAPVITGPADITDIWGIPTDVGSTGSATAVDACDPAPVVTMIDETIIPQTGPGLEQTIIRTWEAVDYCNFTSQVSQTIMLLSPMLGSANLEVDINQCDDIFDRNDAANTFDVVVLGKVGTQISALKLDTLKLSLLGSQSGFVSPTNPLLFTPQDVAVRAATQLGECNPAGTDGLKDLRLRFDRKEVRQLLGLDQMTAGTPVYIAITGQRKLNNAPFICGAKMLVK